jgi:hypothetical protein
VDAVSDNNQDLVWFLIVIFPLVGHCVQQRLSISQGVEYWANLLLFFVAFDAEDNPWERRRGVWTVERRSIVQDGYLRMKDISQ